MLRVLRQRDFGLLFAAAVVSQAGDYVLFIALPYWVYRLTGSASTTGLMFVAITVPQFVLSPIAGVFVDRWNRKTTMIAADLLRAGIIAGLLAVRGADQVWLIFVLGFAESVVSRFFFPARSAVLPMLVDPEQLPQVNAAMGLIEPISQLGGPALGGVLVAVWGPHGAALVDAASYLASAAAIALVAIPLLPRTAGTERRGGIGAIAQELSDGVHLVLVRPALRVAIGVIGVFQLSQGIINVLIVVAVARIWGGGAREFGWLISVQGIGAVAAGPLLSSLAGRLGARALMVLGGVVCGGMLFAMVNQPSLGLALVLVALAGAAVVGFFIGSQTLLQRGSDDENRGRVMSLMMTAQAGARLLSMLCTAAVAGFIGVVPLLDVAALLMALGGAVALFAPADRSDRVATPPAGLQMEPEA